MEKSKHDAGEIMIEGTIIMVLTMLIMVWILGVGFVYYQRYLVTAITNDAAVKIAATYNNPDSDIIMGYITTENLSERDLYRNFNNNSLFAVNESKADAYVQYLLKKTNFAGTIKEVNVEMKLVQDNALRKHVEITTICTFNTPFGSALKLFGMKDTATYKSVSRADCTDIIDYISTVDFASYQLSGAPLGSSVIKMINSLIGVFNHSYAET